MTWPPAVCHREVWKSISVLVGINMNDCCGTCEAWWSAASLPRVTECFAVSTCGSWYQRNWAFCFQDPERATVTGTAHEGSQMCLSTNNKDLLLSVCTSLVPGCVRQRGSYIPHQTSSQKEKMLWKGRQISNVKLMLCIGLLLVLQSGRSPSPAIDSMPNYLDWMLDARYSSHPNIIRD